MGTFEPTKPLDHQASVKLKSWATEFTSVQDGLSPTCPMHGYSGLWQAETVYETWRRIHSKTPIRSPQSKDDSADSTQRRKWYRLLFLVICKSTLVVVLLNLRSATELSLSKYLAMEA
jgi:hypothetical protein